jgi:hypothetical protein
MKASRGTPLVYKISRGDKDVMVGTTAGGLVGDNPTAPKKPSVTFKPTTSFPPLFQ